MDVFELRNRVISEYARGEILADHGELSAGSGIRLSENWWSSARWRRRARSGGRTTELRS